MLLEFFDFYIVLHVNKFFFFGSLLHDILYHIFILHFLLREFYFSKMIYVQNLIVECNNLVF